MDGKIALEEHVSTPLNNQLWDSSGEGARNGADYMAWVEHRLLDTELRLADMDANGIGRTILSLTSPGVQSLLDVDQATSAAREQNDYVAETYVAAAPERLSAFAAVAVQDPGRAGDELQRAVEKHGMVGALINGYTNIGDADTAQYLDEEPVWPFWAKVAELGVPVYLHPREPLPSQRRIYDGYDALIGSAWAFAHETATHAIRLMLSGLFDEFPNLTVIIGHLGEGLPLLLPRLEHRLHKQRDGVGLGKAKHPVGHYFSNNFYVTTSGHFHTKGLLDTISEIGANRVLFSADYPYESMADAAEWFDNALIADNDRIAIGRTNSEQLFRLT